MLRRWLLDWRKYHYMVTSSPKTESKLIPKKNQAILEMLWCCCTGILWNGAIHELHFSRTLDDSRTIGQTFPQEHRIFVLFRDSEQRLVFIDPTKGLVLQEDSRKDAVLMQGGGPLCIHREPSPTRTQAGTDCKGGIGCIILCQIFDSIPSEVVQLCKMTTNHLRHI